MYIDTCIYTYICAGTADSVRTVEGQAMLNQIKSNQIKTLSQRHTQARISRSQRYLKGSNPCVAKRHSFGRGQ